MTITNTFMASVCALTLTGCVMCPPKPPVIETKVIKVKVPEEFLNVPPYGKKVDVELSTQKEISQWILDTEERMYVLEQQLNKIREYNDKSVTE